MHCKIKKNEELLNLKRERHLRFWVYKTRAKKHDFPGCIYEVNAESSHHLGQKKGCRGCSRR